MNTDVWAMDLSLVDQTVFLEYGQAAVQLLDEPAIRHGGLKLILHIT